MHLRFSWLTYKHLMITSGSDVKNILCYMTIYNSDAIQIISCPPPSLLVSAVLLSALV